MPPFSETVGAQREPEFRKLFFGQAASIAGSMLTLVALPFAGPVTDLIGIPATLWIGAGCAAAVSLFWLSWRDVRAVHELGPKRAAADGG